MSKLLGYYWLFLRITTTIPTHLHERRDAVGVQHSRSDRPDRLGFTPTPNDFGVSLRVLASLQSELTGAFVVYVWQQNKSFELVSNQRQHVFMFMLWHRIDGSISIFITLRLGLFPPSLDTPHHSAWEQASGLFKYTSDCVVAASLYTFHPTTITITTTNMILRLPPSERLSLCFLLGLILSARASPQNFTLDDQLGDPSGNAQVLYLPSNRS